METFLIIITGKRTVLLASIGWGQYPSAQDGPTLPRMNNPKCQVLRLGNLGLEPTIFLAALRFKKGFRR